MGRTQPDPNALPVHFIAASTRTVAVPGARPVYRELGAAHVGVPLVALTHLGANLDSWDPEVVDGLAEGRRVIMIGYRSVGASTGSVQDRLEDMAGAGPQVGAGLIGMTGVMIRTILRGLAMLTPATPAVFRAQLRAFARWGRQRLGAATFTRPSPTP